MIGIIEEIVASIKNVILREIGNSPNHIIAQTYQSTLFEISSKKEDVVDGCYLIYLSRFGYKHRPLPRKIVGIAHSEEEVSQKIYELAVRYAEEEARTMNKGIIDLTSRAKPSKLEVSTITAE